jgi:hypothetical protein
LIPVPVPLNPAPQVQDEPVAEITWLRPQVRPARTQLRPPLSGLENPLAHWQEVPVVGLMIWLIPQVRPLVMQFRAFAVPEFAVPGWHAQVEPVD